MYNALLTSAPELYQATSPTVLCHIKPKCAKLHHWRLRTSQLVLPPYGYTGHDVSMVSNI